MDSQRKQLAAMAANAAVIALEFLAIGACIADRGVADNFMYYTQCSNLLGAVACALCLAGEARGLRGGEGPGRAARMLKYAASCCLLMTLAVTALVLAPMLESVGSPGFYLMFAEWPKPVVHLIGPLLVTCSYMAFEAERDITLRRSLIGVAPTLAYAMVAYPCNIARLWDGPYPFLQVWGMPVWKSALWFVVLLVAAFALAQIPRLAARLPR